MDDLLNEYDIFFENDLDDDIEDITWETSTKYGTGEINDNGDGVLRLHTFCPDDLEDIKNYDTKMSDVLHEFHEALNGFFLINTFYYLNHTKLFSRYSNPS